MERVVLYLVDLKSMLQEFNIALNKLERVRANPTQYDADDIQTYRNSAIKSFEISYELFWKTLKAYLNDRHGIALNSPKGIFHQCEKIEFLSNDETKFLFAMADIRNNTTHDYGKDMAEEISRKIPAYYEFMSEIAKRIK